MTPWAFPQRPGLARTAIGQAWPIGVEEQSGRLGSRRGLGALRWAVDVHDRGLCQVAVPARITVGIVHRGGGRAVVAFSSTAGWRPTPTPGEASCPGGWVRRVGGHGARGGAAPTCLVTWRRLGVEVFR